MHIKVIRDHTWPIVGKASLKLRTGELYTVDDVVGRSILANGVAVESAHGPSKKAVKAHKEEVSEHEQEVERQEPKVNEEPPEAPVQWDDILTPKKTDS